MTIWRDSSGNIDLRIATVVLEFVRQVGGHLTVFQKWFVYRIDHLARPGKCIDNVATCDLLMYSFRIEKT